MPKDRELDDLVTDFTGKLVTYVESRTAKQVEAMLAPILQRHTNGVSSFSLAPRARTPILCPVPGCKNTAAPRFGMVCGEHKDLPKGEIKKYREERKAAVKEAKSKATSTPKKSAGKRPAIPVR